MTWVDQAYSVNGMLADMTEGEPQYTSWRAYVESCLYDGNYKAMDVVRMWGFNLGDDETLTFERNEL